MNTENKDGLDWSIKPNKPLIEDSEKPFVAKSKMFCDLHTPDYIITGVQVIPQQPSVTNIYNIYL